MRNYPDWSKGTPSVLFIGYKRRYANTVLNIDVVTVKRRKIGGIFNESTSENWQITQNFADVMGK